MLLYLVQHAEAKREEEDAARDLTEKGRMDIESVAHHLKRLNVQVRQIFHSGKSWLKNNEAPLLDGFFEEVFVDFEGVDLRFQSRGRNTELGGCTQPSRHAAAAFSQSSLNNLFCLNHQHIGERLAGWLSLTRLPNQPMLIDRKLFRVTDDDRSFNHIL